MTTNIQDVAPYDTIADFDSTAILIRRTFNVLIEQLIKRRDTLCQEVAQLRDDFHSKESTRMAAIEELEKTQQQLQQMSMKINTNLLVHEQADLVYQNAKKQQSVPTPLPNLSFSCPTLSLLQSQIEQFGKIVQPKAPKYSEKKQPILTAGKEHDETGVVPLDASSLESETGSETGSEIGSGLQTDYNGSEYESVTTHFVTKPETVKSIPECIEVVPSHKEMPIFPMFPRQPLSPPMLPPPFFSKKTEKKKNSTFFGKKS